MYSFNKSINVSQFDAKEMKIEDIFHPKKKDTNTEGVFMGKKYTMRPLYKPKTKQNSKFQSNYELCNIMTKPIKINKKFLSIKDDHVMCCIPLGEEDGNDDLKKLFTDIDNYFEETLKNKKITYGGTNDIIDSFYYLPIIKNVKLDPQSQNSTNVIKFYFTSYRDNDNELIIDTKVHDFKNNNLENNDKFVLARNNIKIEKFKKYFDSEYEFIFHLNIHTFWISSFYNRSINNKPYRDCGFNISCDKMLVNITKETQYKYDSDSNSDSDSDSDSDSNSE
jgi:hypothetical protein